MMATTSTLRVCVDCLHTHANGETAGEPDREPLGLIPDGCTVALGMSADEHSCGGFSADGVRGECGCEDFGFSWRECEGCGSALGGDRFALTMWDERD